MSTVGIQLHLAKPINAAITGRRTAQRLGGRRAAKPHHKSLH
jgi:hypothetical protein